MHCGEITQMRRNGAVEADDGVEVYEAAALALGDLAYATRTSWRHARSLSPARTLASSMMKRFHSAAARRPDVQGCGTQTLGYLARLSDRK
jgi:hypothetical protein